MTGRVPGLSGLRSDLEHHPKPCDPIADDIQLIIDELSADWGEWYEFTCDGRWWWYATRRDRTGELRAHGPDDLRVAMRADLESRGEAGGASC
jgi:hypothetical protein